MTLRTRLEQQPSSAQNLMAWALTAMLVLLGVVCVLLPVRWMIQSQSRWRAQTQSVLLLDRSWVTHASEVRTQLEQIKSSAWWMQAYQEVTVEQAIVPVLRHLGELL